MDNDWIVENKLVDGYRIVGIEMSAAPYYSAAKFPSFPVVNELIKLGAPIKYTGTFWLNPEEKDYEYLGTVSKTHDDSSFLTYYKWKEK
jgi:hypothetical protein